MLQQNSRYWIEGEESGVVRPCEEIDACEVSNWFMCYILGLVERMGSNKNKTGGGKLELQLLALYEFPLMYISPAVRGTRYV